MDNLVLEKIIDSILSSNKFGIEKWMIIILIALLPVLINILYKRVNSKYYNIDEKYFNFLSLKRVLIYIAVFLLVILTFAYLFYGAIIDFSLEDTIFYLFLLSLLCIAAVICIFNINFNLIFEGRIYNNKICLIPMFIVLIILTIAIIAVCKSIKFKYFPVKYLIFFVVAVCVCVLCFMIKKNKHCKCKSLKMSHYIIINSIPLLFLSLLSVSLISCLVFSNIVNENLNNSVEKNSKINQNQYQDISEENKKNNNATKEYLNYVLRNSGDLKAKEFVMLYNNPEDLIRLDVSYKSGVNKSILKLYLVRFFYNVEKANIQKELFASMRLLIILNLLLEPIIFIFAMASIFILTGALLLLLRERFFNPKKIKIYEYIDKPGLMKEVVITEYKDKLVVMEGLIYKENLYLVCSNYRIIDISDTEIFAQKTFKSVVVDMLDFVIPASIIDCNREEIKCSFDISLNLEKEAINIKNLEYDTRGIDIICDVIFKNGRMIIKSEIKHILETIYGINNFKFKLDESVKDNFSIDENTGEITINLDLK